MVNSCGVSVHVDSFFAGVDGGGGSGSACRRLMNLMNDECDLGPNPRTPVTEIL